MAPSRGNYPVRRKNAACGKRRARTEQYRLNRCRSCSPLGGAPESIPNWKGPWTSGQTTSPAGVRVVRSPLVCWRLHHITLVIRRYEPLSCIFMSSLLNSVGVGVSVDVDDIGFEVWQGVLHLICDHLSPSAQFVGCPKRLIKIEPKPTFAQICCI